MNKVLLGLLAALGPGAVLWRHAHRANVVLTAAHCLYDSDR